MDISIFHILGTELMCVSGRGLELHPGAFSNQEGPNVWQNLTERVSSKPDYVQLEVSSLLDAITCEPTLPDIDRCHPP